MNYMDCCLAWLRKPLSAPVSSERLPISGSLAKRMQPVFAIAIAALGLCMAGSAQSKPATGNGSRTNTAHSEDAQLYRNATFGFRYQIPYGWVDRTKEMQADDEAGKAQVLLGVFEHPPEVTGDTVNSAVVIAAESTASYPGLKKAEDYLGPLTEIVSARGLKSEGEPYLLNIETRQLVRADFSKMLSDKLTMRQCSLILLAKGQIVSFTFIAASEDELDQLVDRIHFSAKPAGH